MVMFRIEDIHVYLHLTQPVNLCTYMYRSSTCTCINRVFICIHMHTLYFIEHRWINIHDDQTLQKKLWFYPQKNVYPPILWLNHPISTWYRSLVLTSTEAWLPSTIPSLGIRLRTFPTMGPGDGSPLWTSLELLRQWNQWSKLVKSNRVKQCWCVHSWFVDISLCICCICTQLYVHMVLVWVYSRGSDSNEFDIAWSWLCIFAEPCSCQV